VIETEHHHVRAARLPNSAHASRPWQVHEITADFRLEDVWGLPARDERSGFPALVRGIAAGDPSQGSSRLARALWIAAGGSESCSVWMSRRPGSEGEVACGEGVASGSEQEPEPRTEAAVALPDRNASRSFTDRTG
jgi:hypothetical protein